MSHLAVDREAATRLGLTPREIDALVGLALGEECPDTARRLVLSPHTVRGQRKALYSKLQARNGPHAVARAFVEHIFIVTDWKDHS